jgi:hypothetical protein
MEHTLTGLLVSRTRTALACAALLIKIQSVLIKQEKILCTGYHHHHHHHQQQQ